MWDLRSLIRDWTYSPYTRRWITSHWTTREDPLTLKKLFKKLSIYLSAPSLSCGMRHLVLCPWMGPRASAVGAWSLSHWPPGKSWHFSFVVRTLEIYLLSNFQVCSTVLLIVVTVCRFDPGVYSPWSWEFVLSDQHFLFLPTPVPGNHHFTCYFWGFGLFDTPWRWEHTVFAILFLTFSLSIMPSGLPWWLRW